MLDSEGTRRVHAKAANMAQKSSTTPICYRSRDPRLLHHRHLISTTLLQMRVKKVYHFPSLAGRKRRSSSELAQVASSRITTRSVKRPRYVFALFVFTFANPTLASLLRWSTLVCHPRRRAQKKRQKIIPLIRRRVRLRNLDILIPTNDACLIHK